MRTKRRMDSSTESLSSSGTETETDDDDDEEESQENTQGWSGGLRKGFGKSNSGGFSIPSKPIQPQPAGAFGQPAGGFGQPAGGFGQPAGAFGQPAGGFGQPSGAFGKSAGGFGQPAGGLFGQPTGGFGQPSGGFGQSGIRVGGFGFRNHGAQKVSRVGGNNYNRPNWLELIEQVERNVVGLDIAEKYLREHIPSVLELSDEITKLEENECNDEQNGIEAYKKKRIREVLSEEGRVYVDAEEHKALLGLKNEKEKEKHLIAETKKALVLQELSERIRFMDLEFEEEFAPLEAAEASRRIEIEYMNHNIAQLQTESESQRKLTLTIARAQMGDTSPDEIDLAREEQKKKIETVKAKERLQRIENLKSQLLQLRKKMEEDQIDKEMRKFARVALNIKSGPADGTGPTDGDSEDESTIPHPPGGLVVQQQQQQQQPTSKVPKATGKSKPKKVTVSDVTKNTSSKLFGLSTVVTCELWNSMKDPIWRKVLLEEAQQPYFTYLSNVCSQVLFYYLVMIFYYINSNSGFKTFARKQLFTPQHVKCLRHLICVHLTK